MNIKVTLTPTEVEKLLEEKRQSIALLEETVQNLNNELLYQTKLKNDLQSRLTQARDISDEQTKYIYSGVEQDIRDLLGAIFTCPNKIYAIKSVRKLTQFGLKESKDLVEEYWKPYHKIIVTQIPQE